MTEFKIPNNSFLSTLSLKTYKDLKKKMCCNLAITANSMRFCNNSCNTKKIKDLHL